MKQKLVAGDEPGPWVQQSLPNEIHYFPTNGPEHETEDCWCKPEQQYDHSEEKPFIVHRILH